ncbi:PAS domain-containing protein [Sinirhodobacter huangdaonensis]|uniref:PAS domain-containing protein n=1 Tax=Paenirhodobacter huangdaonensis TaxID=2501515 RepID=A0A3S3LBB6_9RHOB|nr:PAS domain-containing protein [Sinirhodobacter huangdaonensis]RWR50285.1 PAS domain-containing protein [Sinirhodobacter huangdaonensis]
MDRDIDDKVIHFGAQAGLGMQVASELRAYWEALRRGRLVPARADVDPRGIERALEYAFILERVAPGIGRFRLAGMHLNELMGMEVRGMPLTALFTPQGRKHVTEALEAVFGGPAIADLRLASESGPGRPRLEARLLILPMKSDLGDITRALGCLVAEGDGFGRLPRRFDVIAAHVEPVIAGAPTPGPLPLPVRPEEIGLDAPVFGHRRPALPEFDTPLAARPLSDCSPEERRAMFRVISNA